MTMKKASPKQLFAVAWVPELDQQLSTQEEVIIVGGRIVDTRLTKLGAEEVERCLNVGAPRNGGEYITVKQQ